MSLISQKLILSLTLSCFAGLGIAQTVDYSVAHVLEETGNDLVKVTSDYDYVAMPELKRFRQGVNWETNRILSVTPNGNEIAFLSQRNNTSNIFIKDLGKKGVSRQRTNKSDIIDFSYSPDGTKICFTERKSKNNNQLFITDSSNGFVCRLITSDSQDYSPIFSPDMQNIFFVRLEDRGCGIWSYDLENNYLSSYTHGMNPCPANDNEIYISRTSETGKGEVWKINCETGTEECILSDAKSSFYSPLLSPDGSKLLLVGESLLVNEEVEYWNTDIYVCNTDGTNLQQMTYHAADDLSPVWSADGNYIYFISRRGSSDAIANIWRMKFNKK